MKLLQILENYDEGLLDQISSDKVDEAVNLRLPKAVIVQEIISALGSQSYISGKILYGKPPVYAILNLILQSPGFIVSVEGFRENVLEDVKNLAVIATLHKTMPEKHTQLYIKILRKAWENDGEIDKSEAYILEVVKQELGIWDREHFTLMHDESIMGLWDVEQEFYRARNQLLASGIILIYENSYVIAEEVSVQVKRTFGIELTDISFRRLLNSLSREELSFVLSTFHLNISGLKDVMIERLIKSLIPPTDLLNAFHLDELREFCRRENITVSGSKNTVVANIIHFFDEERDLQNDLKEEPEPSLPIERQPREMDAEIYKKVLLNLTGQQLYDILFQTTLMTSGSKEEKVCRIMESPWSETYILNNLRKEDLMVLCRRFSLLISGSKRELVDRIIDYNPEIISSPVPNADVSIPVAEVLPEAPNKLKKEIQSSILPSILPVNWNEIDAAFPDMEKGEKIVLAILKDAKSMTEQDLQRISQKYGLNWFLFKAEMAELIAKLKRERKPFIQIKSTQNANIYQWSGPEIRDDQTLEKKSARDIIDALRQGVVPRNNLDLLMVGQQTARNHLSEILLEVGPHKSHFKFIRGQYGSGKTFLCSWLKEFALNHEYAVSSLNISHDQPLSDLPVFFSGVINGLRTPEKKDSSALIDILESWLLNIHKRTAKMEGINPNETAGTQLSEVVEKSIEVDLANLSDIEPGFSQALRSFYEGKVNGNAELVTNAVAWITGSRALPAHALREIGVKGYLEPSTVFPRIRTILEIILGARYKGLLLLVDELELVRKFPHARQREQALEILRLLIDEAGRNAFPGCLIIFTGTDEFFEDERYGLKSYEALAERVLTPFTHENFVSMRQPIISLESLNRERLVNVVLKIRDLYGTAYGFDVNQVADDETIKSLIEEWTLFGREEIDRKPRPILREFIQMLDLCEENKGVSLSQFLKRPGAESLQAQVVNSN
jgi:P-loop Domain of unknown function (DUF2791)